MRVQIKLQPAGMRNHPRWKIVVIPAKKNIRGRYLEHIGWWQPRHGKIISREILLNKERAKYWIAMGAQLTPKIQKFFSYYDLAIPPLPKYGYKTQYEKKPIEPKSYMGLSVYRIRGFSKSQIVDFIDQEEEMKLIRQLQMQNEIIKQLTKPDVLKSLRTEEIKEELGKMQKELASYNDQINELNAGRRRVLISRINKLFSQMLRAEKYQNFVQKVKSESQIYQNNVDSNTQLRRALEKNRLEQKLQQENQQIRDNMDQFSPISRDEFKDFLVDKGFTEAKAEKTLREFYKNDDQAYKLDAISAVTKLPDIEHLNSIHKAYHKKDEKYIFPLPNSVMPRPILSNYEPSDYYEIPQIFEPTQQANKAYSLPNLTDKFNPSKLLLPRSAPKPQGTHKKRRRLRAQNPPQKYAQYRFSTITKGAYISQLEYLQYLKEQSESQQ